MNNKITSLLISIFCVIEAICTFTPFCLNELNINGGNIYDTDEDVNIFGVQNVVGKILAVIFILTTIAVALLYLLNILSRKNISKNIGWKISIIHTLAMIEFFIYSCNINFDSELDYFNYSVCWMFYIIIALNIIILILSLLQELIKPQTRFIARKERYSQKSETAEDLLAYKDLLDSGIITQEEFDDKKRKVLGL